MNTVLFRSSVFVVGLLALNIFTSRGVAQPPGVKARTETKDDKLARAKGEAGGFINLFDAYPDGPGEVDQRKDAFLKKFFGTTGAGLVEIGKKKFFVTIGEQEWAFATTPGWTQQRIFRLDIAELAARAKMVEMIEAKIENQQLFETFQDYGDAVKQNITFIQESLKKGATSARKYKEAIRTFAMSQVIGAPTIKTIEGMNGDKYKIVRIIIWSPTLRDLALNTLLDSDYLLPLEKVTDDDVDQIPQKEADLVREFGCRAYFNKKGQRYYVSYGQAEPLAKSKDEIEIAMDAARDRAELAAKGSLARTLAAETTSLKLADMANEITNFAGKEESTNDLTGVYYKRMETVAKEMKLKGITVHKTWTYKHSEWKSVVVGCVVVWTPDTRTVIKELALDKRFEINRPDALSAYLVKTYTTVEPVRPVEKDRPILKKPGENDSKDPKKLP